MVEKPFAGPISRIFSTDILFIWRVIASAVLQEIFGTDRSSQEIFIFLRNFCSAGERCEIMGIFGINICNSLLYWIDYRYE